MGITSASTYKARKLHCLSVRNRFQLASTTAVIMNRFYTLLLVAFVTASGVKGATDVCGDPVPSSAMREDPGKMIDYLRSLDSNKVSMEKIMNNEFIQMMESGELDKDMMRDWIIQTAYGLETDARSFASAYNHYGSSWPVVENREFYTMCMDVTRDGLYSLNMLAKKFGIADITNLVKNDPNPFAMIWSHALSESVMHAEHHAEIVASMVVTGPMYDRMLQRMKKVLQTNVAYKQWNLNDDDLKYFEIYKTMSGDDSDVKQVTDKVMRQAMDRGMTICQMRRRLNDFDVGRVMFWEACSNKYSPHHDLNAGF